MKNLILASQSPRRKELLQTIVKDTSFACIPADTDETFGSGDLDEALLAVARAKAEAVSKTHPDDLVIGADTIVVHNGKILGKPKNKAEAFATLKALSDGWHAVKTGLVLLGGEKPQAEVVTTKVHFRPLCDDEIEAYVQTGSPLDKAGSYGIQETDFADALEGSFTNVVGLPTELLGAWLKPYGLVA